MYKGAPARSARGQRYFKHRFEPEEHPDLLGGACRLTAGLNR